MKVAVLLFEDFEAFDPSGPVEIFNSLKDHYQVSFYSLSGGVVKNEQGLSFETTALDDIKEGVDILLIPGGPGTRKAADNDLLIDKIKSIAQSSKYVLTLNEGSALLAKTGLLDTKVATYNREAFDWINDISAKIRWERRAMWVVDDKYYTSSGMQGATDMTMAFLIDRHGAKFVGRLKT